MVEKKFKSKNYSTKFLIKATFVVGAIIMAVVILGPWRNSVAVQMMESGDTLLLQKKYLSADLQYEKSYFLSKNQQSRKRRETVARAARDIASLEQFYQEKNQTDQIQKLRQAESVPEIESDAVRKSRELLEAGEYQLAILPAQIAVEMSNNYRDAWLYLGIANLQSAKHLEISADDKNFYLNSAKESLQRAKQIDPNYQPIDEYLRLVDSI